jgi:hypothetical protein
MRSLPLGSLRALAFAVRDDSSKSLCTDPRREPRGGTLSAGWDLAHPKAATTLV